MKKIYSEEDLGILNQVYDCLTNDGVVEYTDDDSKNSIVDLSFADLLSQPDLTRFIPEAVTYILREAQEPITIVSDTCFQEIRMELGQRVEIGAIGAIEAKKIPFSQEYPEAMWNYDGGDMIALSIEKYGVMLKVPQEVIDMNLFDVFGIFLRASGRSIGRIKETDATRMFDSMGVPVFDNLVPTNSQYGVCTGRDVTGAQNGSMTTNDIFDMYAFGQMRGFNMNTLIMNPLSWRMFMADPETREVVLKGATVASRKIPTGSYSPGWGVGHKGLGVVTRATGGQTAGTAQGPPSTAGKIGASPWVTTLNPLASSYTIAPNYLPSPLQVLVTPYVSYTAGTTVGEAGRADVIMVDSERAGIMATNGKGIEAEEFQKPETDITAMKVRAYWGTGALEQGKGVLTAKDVVIARNYSFENANNATISGFDHTTAISNSGKSQG